MPKLVVGLDVSTKTGIVVMDTGGSVIEAKEIVLESLPTGSGPGKRVERSLVLGKKVYDAINGTRRAQFVAVEGYSHASPFGAALAVELGSAVRFACYKAKVPFVEVAPATLKKFATGVGKGDKSVVRLGVYKKWGFEHESDNVVDAYVLARIALAAVGGMPMTAAERMIVGALRK